MSARSAKASKESKRRDPAAKYRLPITPEDTAALVKRHEAVKEVIANVEAFKAEETASPAMKELIEPLLAMACTYLRPLAAKGEERETLADVGSALMFRFVDRQMQAMTASAMNVHPKPKRRRRR